MLPPAEIEQYSNRPSNTGQSSPTLSTDDVQMKETDQLFPLHHRSQAFGDRRKGGRTKGLTFPLFFPKEVHVLWRDAAEELDVLIRMKLGHLSLRCRFRSLYIGRDALRMISYCKQRGELEARSERELTKISIFL
jgi:hypothetical protein